MFFRWYAGIGLGCVVLLIVLLQFCGLGCGTLGYSKDVETTDRNCLSNAGGEVLMSSV